MPESSPLGPILENLKSSDDKRNLDALKALLAFSSEKITPLLPLLVRTLFNPLPEVRNQGAKLIGGFFPAPPAEFRQKLLQELGKLLLALTGPNLPDSIFPLLLLLIEGVEEREKQQILRILETLIERNPANIADLGRISPPYPEVEELLKRELHQKGAEILPLLLLAFTEFTPTFQREVDQFCQNHPEFLTHTLPSWQITHTLPSWQKWKDQIKKALQHPNEKVREYALCLMAEMDGSLKILTEALKDPSQDVRVQALWLLSQQDSFPAKEGMAPLLDLLNTTPQESERTYLNWTIEKIGVSEIHHLKEILRGKSPELQLFGCFWAGQMGERASELAERIEEIFQSNEKMTLYAPWALGRIGSPTSEKVLLENPWDGDAEKREMILWALLRVAKPSPRLFEILLSSLEDSHEPIQKYALRGLIKFPPSPALREDFGKALAKKLQNSRDDVMMVALETIENLCSRGFIDPWPLVPSLFNLMKREDLRFRALRVLKKIARGPEGEEQSSYLQKETRRILEILLERTRELGQFSFGDEKSLEVWVSAQVQKKELARAKKAPRFGPCPDPIERDKLISTPLKRAPQAPSRPLQIVDRNSLISQREGELQDTLTDLENQLGGLLSPEQILRGHFLYLLLEFLGVSKTPLPIFQELGWLSEKQIEEGDFLLSEDRVSPPEVGGLAPDDTGMMAPPEDLRQDMAKKKGISFPSIPLPDLDFLKKKSKKKRAKMDEMADLDSLAAGEGAPEPKAAYEAPPKIADEAPPESPKAKPAVPPTPSKTKAAPPAAPKPPAIPAPKPAAPQAPPAPGGPPAGAGAAAPPAPPAKTPPPRPSRAAAAPPPPPAQPVEMPPMAAPAPTPIPEPAPAQEERRITTREETPDGKVARGRKAMAREEDEGEKKKEEKKEVEKERARRKREEPAEEVIRPAEEVMRSSGDGIPVTSEAQALPEAPLKEMDEEISRGMAQEIEGEKTLEVAKEALPEEEKVEVPARVRKISRWERALSEDAGRPGPVERIAAQSVFFLRGLQATLGMKFILVANFADMIVDTVAGYIRKIYHVWRFSKSVKRRIDRHRQGALIPEIEKDLLKSRLQLSRIFTLPGFTLEEASQFAEDLPEKDKFLSPTFGLKLALEIRSHLDGMKEDLSILTIEEMKETAKKTIKDFLLSFIPNPAEMVPLFKDFVIFALFLNYSREEIQEMYADLILAYQKMIHLLKKRYAEDIAEWENTAEEPFWAEYEQKLLSEMALPEERDLDGNLPLWIDHCRLRLQRLLQALVNPGYLLDGRSWDRRDLLREVAGSLEGLEVALFCHLEVEKWLRREIEKTLKQRGFKATTPEKEQRWKEERDLRKRLWLQKKLGSQFLH